MGEILRAEGLRKTFKLSAKQQKLEKTKEKIKVAVDDLSFSVNEGEIFGILGPNGAGKSTTIRTLLGLIAPTSGSAELLGMGLDTPRERLLRDVGYLPSEAIFYPGMKAKAVLELSAGLRKADCRKSAAALCDRLQLDPDKKVEELSFGNRKKLGIICALQHDPRLLVLDEPTSGLDPLMQREFFAILEERNKAGATVFLSSHVLGEISRHCSRAAIIREGRIIACDRVEDLARTNARRVAVRGSLDLAGLEVRDLQTLPDGVSFLYSGPMEPLLTALARGTVRDLQITEPDLEEVVLHYYEKGGEAL